MELSLRLSRGGKVNLRSGIIYIENVNGLLSKIFSNLGGPKQNARVGIFLFLDLVVTSDTQIYALKNRKE